MRRVLILVTMVAATLATVSHPPARAEWGWDPAAVTVAVIDTGLSVPHTEFDFDPDAGGPDGQVVAWWDFSSSNTSGLTPGVWFDGAAPHDSHGHGTATAGMAVGRNMDPDKNPSACPGCKLAVAKVANDAGDIDGDLAEAIRWAVDVAHADVVSISIGSLIPFVGLGDNVHQAAGYARDRGVLVVVANGNGWGNAGVPGQPGAVMPYGYSTNVLSVGADGSAQLRVTTDPEVTAAYTVRTSLSNDRYGRISGTSFSAPFVAGAAARLVADAAACGVARPDPDRLEQIIKLTAYDNMVYPPTTEGYGRVDLATTEDAAAVICGDEPAPAPDPVTAFYVDHVSGGARGLWTDGDPSLGLFEVPRPLPRMTESPLTDQTPSHTIGVSAGSWADVEVREVAVAPHATVEVAVTWTDPGSDLDLVAYDWTDGRYDPAAVVASSQTSSSQVESIRVTNHGDAAMVVRVVVSGFLVTAETRYQITGLTAPVVFDGYAAVVHAS